MIVGTKDFDFEELKLATESDEQLQDFVVRLVPTFLRHIQPVMDNQKYYVALYIRNMQSIPYQIRKDRSEKLLEGVSITGVINTVIDFSDILLYTNVETLLRYLEEE